MRVALSKPRQETSSYSVVCLFEHYAKKLVSPRKSVVANKINMLLCQACGKVVQKEKLHDDLKSFVSVSLRLSRIKLGKLTQSPSFCCAGIPICSNVLGPLGPAGFAAAAAGACGFGPGAPPPRPMPGD